VTSLVGYRFLTGFTNTAETMCWKFVKNYTKNLFSSNFCFKKYCHLFVLQWVMTNDTDSVTPSSLRIALSSQPDEFLQYKLASRQPQKNYWISDTQVKGQSSMSRPSQTDSYTPFTRWSWLDELARPSNVSKTRQIDIWYLMFASCRLCFMQRAMQALYMLDVCLIV